MNSELGLILTSLVGFLLFFVAVWLGVTTLLGRLAGLASLALEFPDRPEPVLASLSMQSARLGTGVAFNHCLRLDACPTGLRIAIPRIFAPRGKRFLVPWSAIRVEEARLLMIRRYRLRFGTRGRDEVLVSPSTFDTLRDAGLTMSLPDRA